MGKRVKGKSAKESKNVIKKKNDYNKVYKRNQMWGKREERKEKGE